MEILWETPTSMNLTYWPKYRPLATSSLIQRCFGFVGYLELSWVDQHNTSLCWVLRSLWWFSHVKAHLMSVSVLFFDSV